MLRPPLCIAVCACVLAGCATRSADVRPEPANPADFLAWHCSRIDDELDLVQQRAAEVAYTVDERAGNNIVALGVGVTIFWPAILAMRPDGLEAADLARLKGRFEALKSASHAKACPPPPRDLPPDALPVAVGERLVYEDRVTGRARQDEWTLRVVALRRDEHEFRLEPPAGGAPWRQDRAGNVTAAPPGALAWHRLLRRDLELGQVVAGEVVVSGDPDTRARVRGQVVAVGPQNIADRRFDAVVIDLFGDAQHGEAVTRLDGGIVVDRASGVLLRLDLRCGLPEFNLQRRLSSIER